MANNLDNALDKAKQDIKDITANLTELQQVAVKTSQDIVKVLGKGDNSQEKFLKLLTKVNAQLTKLDGLNKKIIVSDGQVKVKKNELALTMQGLAKQRDAQAKKEIAYSKQTIKAIQAEKKAIQVAHQKEIDAIKKSNKERLAEADLIHRNKKLIQTQKKASEAAYDKQVSDIKKANKERLREADLIYQNKQAILAQKKASDTANQKVINDAKKANKARLSEADAIERNKKALQDQKKASTELSRAYVQLVNAQKKAKNVLQDLIVSQGKNSRETKKAQKEYDRLTSKINQANLASTNFSKKGIGSIARGFKNLAFAFGVYGGLNMFVAGLKNTAKRVVEFDKTMQNLAGVFRTTREELKPLEATIIDVAGESIKTSREVASLAESLATLGKSPEQIQKLLKPIVDLGIGLNTASDKAGEFLVEMLNAFGASDDEAAKYADTIATIRTSTTLDFQKMRDSFQYIAPISRLLNKDLAYTGAVVGILADNGLKAQQAGRVLGTSLQKLAVQGKTLTEALEEINKAQENGVKGTELLAMANKSFGAEGAKIGIILAENTHLIEENSQAIRDNGGALDDLVNQQLESLSAKMDIMDAAWEKMIINIDNGTGSISTFFKGALTGFTDLINAASDFNTVSDIIGDSEESNIFEKILPTARVVKYLFDIKRMGLATAEFKAMTESFKSVDLTNIEDVKQVTIDFEKAKIAAKGNVDVIKLIDFYLNKLKTSSDSYYESARNDHDEKMKRDKNARLGVKKDEIMLVALRSRLKDLTYHQKQLGNASTIKASQYESWVKYNEEIAKTKKQIEELTGVKEKDKNASVGYLDGSIAFYEKEISVAKESIKNSALSASEYRNKSKEIENATEKLKELKRTIGIREKATPLDEIESIGISDPDSLTDYQKELLEVLETAKEIEEVPELLPLSPKTVAMLKKYNDELTETALKLSKLEDLKDIFGTVTDTFSEMFDIDMSKFDMFFDGEKNSIEEWAELSKELIGSVLDASMKRYEIELQEAQRVRDITLNNDLASDEAKENARKKFDEQERKIKTEQAKKERENNLIKIAMDTAVAVTKTFAQMGFVAGLPLAAVMLGIGATQAALVASQPLPQFETGGTMSKDGWAITQEKRPEPIVDKFGNLKTMGSVGGDAMTYLNQGDRVFKSQDDFFKEFDVERSVFDMNMRSNGEMLNEKIVDLSLLREVSGLRGDIDKMGKRIEKMASRPINVNNTVEFKEEKPY